MAHPMKLFRSILISITLFFLTLTSPLAVYGSCSDCYAACENNPANTPEQIQRINSCKQYCNDFDTRCGGNSNGGSGSNGGIGSGGSLSTDIESQLDKGSFFKFDSLGGFLQNFIQLALGLGSIATLVWVFWGGIEFIMSGGNQDRTKSAKEKITQALFGLATLATLWVLWRLVIYFLGISSSAQGPFNISIPSP